MGYRIAGTHLERFLQKRLCNWAYQPVVLQITGSFFSPEDVVIVALFFYRYGRTSCSISCPIKCLTMILRKKLQNSRNRKAKPHGICFIIGAPQLVIAILCILHCFQCLLQAGTGQCQKWPARKLPFHSRKPPEQICSLLLVILYILFQGKFFAK